MENKIKLPEFVSFILSPAGRALRVIAGILLLSLGLRLGSPLGNLLAVIALVPLIAGIFDFCIFGKILGGFYNGNTMREALHKQQGKPQLGRKAASFMKA